MFSVILATLVTLQAPTPELYKIEFEQHGLGEGFVRLRIEPQNGYKWGKEYNAVLTLQNNRNVVLAKTRFTARNEEFSYEGTSAYVDIPFKLKVYRDQVVKGTINFLVCNSTRCTPQRNVKVQILLWGEPGC